MAKVELWQRSTKTIEKASLKTAKHVKEAAKNIAKKFAKAEANLQMEKAAAIARKPIVVKPIVLKAMPKAARKTMSKATAKVFRKK